MRAPCFAILDPASYMQPSSCTTSVSVFWPSGISTKEGICYGWLEPTICIAGVLEGRETDIRALSLTLSSSPAWAAIRDICGGDPTLLGTCQFDNRSPVPTHLELYFLENRPIRPTISYILYHPHAPKSLRFYTLEMPSFENVGSKSSTEPEIRDPYRELAQYDFTRSKPRNIEKAINKILVNQLNASSVVQFIVEHHTQPNSSRTSSTFSTLKLLPTTATFLLTLASYLGLLSNLSLSLYGFATRIVNLPLPSISYIFGISEPDNGIGRYVRLKDISATVQQIDVRIEQAVFFITQVTSLQRQNTRDIASYSYRYTNFFNTSWLVLNDMTLGIALGTFLSENALSLSIFFNEVMIKTYFFDLPRTVLFWLNSWPAGLKLNTQLSEFYVSTLVGILDTWESLLPPLGPTLFITLGFLSSIGGLTLLLSLTSDILFLFLTVHLRLGYEVTRMVYWAAGVKLGGGLLWGVFRGKRRNVLRNRTDTWSYDIDQLLFGTVLFTLLAFLFPTALAYYTLFAGLRLAMLLFQASIETLLAFMHHFPLFALMLRVKDPRRLPSSVYFRLRVQNPGEGKTRAEPAYLVLENRPIPISSIFFQYIELSHRLANHYNPLRLLWRVLTGRHLSSIPRYSIRYTIPAQNGKDGRESEGEKKRERDKAKVD